MSQLPIVIDLDGTLIQSDMLFETGLHVLKRKPLSLLAAPWYLLRGKAAFKHWLMQHVDEFNYEALPYNETLLQWLREQKAAGRRLVLCTASDQQVAHRIASQLGIFDEVMASDGQRNLSGSQKAQALVDRFGEAGFDYAGNAKPDLAVWQHAHQPIVVNASTSLTRVSQDRWANAQVMPIPSASIADWLKGLRVHQWLKNLLIFIPLLAAHKLSHGAAWWGLFLAFAAFSCCASAIYILNDLLDLESDRLHPRKRLRPFASGRLPIWQGLLTAPLLLGLSFGVGAQVNAAFVDYLLLYFFLTSIYSWGLKRLMLVDCLTLSGLYTLRILAGGAAAGIKPSFWLLAFSVFIFLSLAFIKRYVELAGIAPDSPKAKAKAHGRGYFHTDAPLIQMFGITSGYSAVVVLALYFNSDTVQLLYKDTGFTWAAIPVVLFWVSWMWMQAHRGQMHDDPIVFAIKDKISLVAGLCFAGVLAVGATGLLS